MSPSPSSPAGLAPSPPGGALLVVSASQVLGLGALLQQGVRVPATTGCSVRSFLVDQLGIEPRYVRERITTVFLDGKVVDSLDQVELREGALLALSAALPGLVGATLRMGGAYSAMRSAISRAADAAPGGAAAHAGGVVRVKVFNLLIEELGPVLLRHGLLLERAEAARVLGPAVALPPGARVLLRCEPSGVST